MIHKTKIFVLTLAVSLLSACELDLLENPNAVNSSNADVNFILTRIQLDFATNFNSFSDTGMRLTRMLNLGADIYDNAVTPGGQDFRWNTAYSGILTDIAALLPLVESGELFVHAGIARTIRAATLMSLVDAYGDVPWTEALDAANFNPKGDDDEAVYAAALADLDKAIENFSTESKGGAPGDLIYGGNTESWIRAANSLKLKYYLNRRLIDPAGSKSAIEALISADRLTSTGSQNLVFKFGTNLNNPDTRHPRYGGQYSPTGGGDYQSNSFMGHMYDSKGFPDPRMRFYFYRQTIANPTDVNQLRCINNSAPAHYGPNDVFCLPGTVGYWGRDHLSNEGIPPDGLLRTAWGLYPAGGLYDNDAGKGVSLGAGAGGAGIHPIMMRSFVDFMLAESALTLKTSGDPRALLKSAVEKSMADVRSFVLSSTEASKINSFESEKGIVWATEVENYVNQVLANYDGAGSEDARLNVIATEYWVALYGNGIEAYNLYRRTGKPAGQQPALDPNPGSFIRTYYYPTGYVTRNSNAAQKPNVTVQVFWDNNPADFVK